MEKKFLNNAKAALSAGEWEKARRFLETSIEEEETGEVYEELAWSCWWLNDTPKVFEHRLKAYNLYLENNDKLGASRTASWICLDYLDFKGDFAVASGWLQRAENLLEGLEDSPELGFIKILKARQVYMTEKNSQLSFNLIDESLKMCKSFDNTEVEMIAKGLKGFILVIEGNIPKGMPLLDEATVLAVHNQKNDLNLATITCCYLIDACERIRDYERARQWCNNVKDICKSWRYEAMFTNCRIKLAGVLIWKGEWKEAEEELLAAKNEFAKFRPDKINASIVRLADLRRRQGRWNESETLFNQVHSHPLKLLYSAAFNFDKGEYDIALEMVTKYLRRFELKEKTERTTGIELLIRIYLKLNKLEEAGEALNELKGITKSINTLPMKAAQYSAEGNLNLAYKNYHFAQRNLEDAIDIYDEIISPFESSRDRVILSEVLIKLNKLAQAELELNTAMKKFKELGAQKDFDNTKHQLKHLYESNAGLKENIYEFTGRELEVLKLIAEGNNNEEIAEKLFLSVRTVEKHITNIYGKLGISGKSARAYAASYAIKHKLIFN